MYVTIQSDIYSRCIMALIRGTNSNFPCPVCLVPGEGMCKGSVGVLRTTKHMKRVYHEADKMDSAQLREDYLKGYGLRYIQVCWISLLSAMHSHCVTFVW